MTTTTGEPGPTAVGMIVPADFGHEAELRRWVPPTASLHLARAGSVPSPSTAAEALTAAAPGGLPAASSLPGVGVVALGCTPAAVAAGADGEAALTGRLRAGGAPRALTSAGALVEACAALGVDRVALVTPHTVTRYATGGRVGEHRSVMPYLDPLTALLEGFLTAHGVSCVGRTGLGRHGAASGVASDEIARAVRTADRPDAQAVLVTCVNLPGYDVVAELERELGKPVVTAAQATVWAALGALGQPVVGPGQSLAARRVPRPAEPAPPEPAVHGDGLVPPPAALHKVRVRLPDESGALARLAAAVAGAGGNILGLAVHGQDGRSVVDELLVGGDLPATRLAAAARSVLRPPEAATVLVAPADPRELVDAPTRALDLAAGARDAGGVAEGLAALLHADSATVTTDGTDSTDSTDGTDGTDGTDAGGHLLDLPAPDGGRLRVRRAWAPFTVTERARAEAYLRLVRAGDPVRPATAV